MAQPTWIGYELSGRYKIEEALGQGGMSAVYKASDPNLKRIVAVKLIHPHLSKDPEFVRRFEAEAAAVAQLRHPNIIQVFDFNHDGDTYYMVLEFVPGETLQAMLKRLNQQKRALPLEKVVKYAAQVCDAVEYAHKRNLIHRDIKPANVMINIHDQAILMDFGIVKIVGGTHHTATGAVVGTALYMSPEQIRGEHPDHRADIYSIGVMLFEMAGGRPPYSADSAMTIMMMHLNDPVPDISKLNPNVPPGLKAIIQKALAKNPSDRYQTAAEMAADLRNLLKPQPAATVVEDAPAGATVVEEPAAAATALEAAPPPPRGGTGTVSPPGAGGPGGTGVRGMGTTAPASRPAQKPGIPRNLLIGGAAIIVLALICLIGGGIAARQFVGRGGEEGIGGAQTEVSQAPAGGGAAEVTPTDTQAPTEPPPPTETPLPPTATDVPTEAPTPTVTPTPTPEGPWVEITNIALEGNYVVDYQVHQFPEDQPGMHVHVFFDTVPPEQAGVPGGGPWKLTYGQYGDPPFTGYGPANRGNANQLCVLVANANHTVIPESGNCVDLPEE